MQTNKKQTKKCSNSIPAFPCLLKSIEWLWFTNTCQRQSNDIFSKGGVWKCETF